MGEARYVEHEGRLLGALAELDVEADGDRAAGRAVLERLIGEPYDFTVSAAKIAVAILHEEAGDQDDAETMMRAALAEWHTRQVLDEPATAIERDVTAIRAAVFLPRGGGVYDGSRWNAFRWEDAPREYVMVRPEVQVRLADGSTVPVSLRQGYAHRDDVLVLDGDQELLLAAVVDRLGGTKKREPATFMETPNQPVGGSRRIISFMNRFFAARPGHWSGWELYSYPVITEIEFLDEARTRARVAVTIGYSGGDVLVEKGPGGWRATEASFTWIT